MLRLSRPGSQTYTLRSFLLDPSETLSVRHYGYITHIAAYYTCLETGDIKRGQKRQPPLAEMTASRAWTRVGGTHPPRWMKRSRCEIISVIRTGFNGFNVRVVENMYGAALCLKAWSPYRTTLACQPAILANDHQSCTQALKRQTEINHAWF